VYYGADLDTGVIGSGFPRRGESEDPYATHPWNVNNFPKLDGEHASLLKNVHENIQGVIVPWLYIGMMFSAFCWHVEDHMFYSINYNHYGAPKQWCAPDRSLRSTAQQTSQLCAMQRQ
jgi:[histone H3]-trimethyl-L-lysine4 demethylase